MKINKIETNITFFILLFSNFLINFHSLSILSIIIGSILAFLLITLTNNLNLTKYKLTKIIIFLISISILPIFLNKITYFISSNILRNYSGIVISFLILLTSFILIKKGYHTIIKVVLLSSYFFIFILILGIFLSSFYLKIENYDLSIINDNNLFINSLYYGICIFYIYLICYLKNAKFNIKTFIYSNLFNLGYYLFIIGILGNTLLNIYEYPYIVIYKKINLLNFIERIEFIFSINYLFCLFYLFTFIYFSIKNNLIIKKNKYKSFILIVITILIFITSILIN